MHPPEPACRHLGAQVLSHPLESAQPRFAEGLLELRRHRRRFQHQGAGDAGAPRNGAVGREYKLWDGIVWWAVPDAIEERHHRLKGRIGNQDGAEEGRLAGKESVEVGARDASFDSELIHGQVGQGARAQQPERDLEHALTGARLRLHLKRAEESGPGGKSSVEGRP